MHEPDNFPKDPSSLRKYRQKIADVGKKLVTEYIRQEILSSGVDVNKESNGLIQKGRYSFRERKVKSINSDRTDEDVHLIDYISQEFMKIPSDSKKLQTSKANSATFVITNPFHSDDFVEVNNNQKRSFDQSPSADSLSSDFDSSTAGNSYVNVGFSDAEYVTTSLLSAPWCDRSDLAVEKRCEKQFRGKASINYLDGKNSILSANDHIGSATKSKKFPRLENDDLYNKLYEVVRYMRVIQNVENEDGCFYLGPGRGSPKPVRAYDSTLVSENILLNQCLTSSEFDCSASTLYAMSGQYSSCLLYTSPSPRD